MLITTKNDHDGYYASTAYDSTKPRYLPPADNGKFGYMMRKFRRNMIPNHGSAQCREFLYDYDQISIIEELNSSKREALQAIQQPGQEVIFWQTMRNPFAAIEVFTRLMVIFLIISWFVVIVSSVIGAMYWPGWLLTPGFLFHISIPSIFTILYLIGKGLLKSNLIKDKNNILFNRRKGSVSIPDKKGQLRELPFDEFDGYVGETVNPSGSSDYHLILAHRYTASFVQHPGGGDAPWKTCAVFEHLQQYMDVSEPLPDIPCFEPFRHKDPVTAEYDRRHGRPKDYWKSLDLKVAEQLHDASFRAASEYPWGMTREQALAAGWQPSGVGEGDWQQRETESMPHAKGL